MKYEPYQAPDCEDLQYEVTQSILEESQIPSLDYVDYGDF